MARNVGWFYRNVDVLTAARKRMRWIFEEFEHVCVSWSGGKDSSVTLHLALETARELGRLPLTVVWLDQEAEWQATVDLAVATLVNNPDVKFDWYQVPIRLLNSSDLTADGTISESWLDVYNPEKEADWVHPRHPAAIHESPFETDRFAKWLDAYCGMRPGAYLNGMRIEESPGRRLGLMNSQVYKQATWGAMTETPGSYRFCPIYDWSWRDVWRYIYDNDVPYNRLYDTQYQLGIPIRAMRVSSLIHETAVRNLYYAHEAEPETWNRMVNRIAGIGATHHIAIEDMFDPPKELPFMFGSWHEYRDYLIENLVPPSLQQGLRSACASIDKLVKGTPYERDVGIVRGEIKGVLSGYRTQLDNMEINIRSRLRVMEEEAREAAEYGVR